MNESLWYLAHEKFDPNRCFAVHYNSSIWEMRDLLADTKWEWPGEYPPPNIEFVKNGEEFISGSIQYVVTEAKCRKKTNWQPQRSNFSDWLEDYNHFLEMAWNDPATDKQRQYALHAFGIEIPPNATRRQASDMIDAAKAGQGQQQQQQQQPSRQYTGQSQQQRPRQQPPQQKRGLSWETDWSLATAKQTIPELGFEAGEKLAVAQTDGGWKFAILDHEDGRLGPIGDIPANLVRDYIQSDRNEAGKPILGKKPSDLLKQLMPKKGKESGVLPDDKMTDEGKSIEARFEQMLASPGPAHMVINALAGTGKTTMLRHLSEKYGKPGQKWLYLVFNSRNKAEAEGKFPSWVTVRTTNGFGGDVLDANDIEPTTRMIELHDSQKLQLVSDGPQFQAVMSSMNIKSHEQLPPKYKTDRRLTWFVRSIHGAFKAACVKLTEITKAFAVDPRRDDLEQKVQDVMGKYDYEDKLDDVREMISEDPRSKYYNEIISEFMGVENFLSHDFSDEIKDSTIWLLKKTMPHAIDQEFEASKDDPRARRKKEGSARWRKGDVMDLKQTRDFSDDLWFSATHADQLDWTKPTKWSVVLADEVQDFNEAQKIMLQKLHESGAKIVAVGDPQQCVVKGTLITMSDGSEIPVEKLQEGQEVLSAKGNGLTINSKITEKYSRYIEDELVRIKTTCGKEIITTKDHTHFAGFMDRIQSNWHVYLMYRSDLGYRIGVTQNFRLRLNGERADKLWLLCTCKDKTEARYYEQFYSIKYGLPTWMFVVEGRSVYYNNHYVNKLFDNIDTEANANKLAKDLRISLDKPHHIPQCNWEKRPRNFVITLCADNRHKSLHHYAISGINPHDVPLLQEMELSVRPAKKGVRGWRIESVNSDLGYIYKLLSKIKEVLDVEVIEKARLTNKSLPYCPAQNVLVGMKIFVADDKGDIVEDEVAQVDYIEYKGEVYDINIDRYHNYIANGVVTHNSIYRFRGADSKAFSNLSSNMKQWSGSDEGVSQTLTKNFRSRQEILDFINQRTIMSNLPEDQRLKAGKKFKRAANITDMELSYTDSFDQLQKEKDHLGEGEWKTTAYISRTNAPLAQAALELLSKGIPFAIMGKDIISDLVAHIRKMRNMKIWDDSYLEDLREALDEYQRDKNDAWHGQETKRGSLSDLKGTTKALLSAIDAAQESNENVTTVKEFIDWLYSRIGAASTKKDPSEMSKRELAEFKKKLEELNPVVLTTSHKSKGLEFERVYILRDDQFPHPKAKREEDLEQEENARYVAYTRAMDDLHILDLEDQPGYSA